MNSKSKLSILVFLVIIMSIFLFAKLFYRQADYAGSATLSWEAVKDDSLKGYKIYYGTSPRKGDCPGGSYSKSKDVGNVTSYSLADLEDGKTYYFSVTSYNASRKESCFSAEMQKEIHLSFWDKLKKMLRR
jgi:hypothetical protein